MGDPTPSLDLLDAGVYAWLQEPSRFGRPNAGVIVEDDGVTVVDTLMVPSQWTPFAAAVTDLGLPVRRVVLTSSHIEFVGGTGVFRLSAIYGSRQTSAHLDQPADVDVFRHLLPEFADEFVEVTTRPVSHLVTESAMITPAVGAIATGGELVENLMALVPGAGILFAGAMCSFGVTPLCFQGDPERWADALDDVIALAPIVVPGHGPIGGEEEVREQQAYLRAVVAAKGDPGAIPPGPWDRWTNREHDVVNVERAAMLARGDTDVPPSMLRAAGLL